MGKPLTDIELVRSIHTGGKAAEQAVGQLYRSEAFWKMARLEASKWGDGPTDVDDLFAEALWRLYDNIKKGSFNGDSTLLTYFGGIIKNISLNEYTTRKRRSEKLAGMASPEEAVATESVLIKEKKALLEEVMKLLPEKCKTVLTLWANGLSMEELMRELGFENLDAAKNKKKNCLNSLRKWMLDNPEKAKWFKY